MKKKLIFVGIVSSILFSVNVLAEEVGQVENSVEAQTVVKEKEEDAAVDTKVLVDATTYYSIDQQKLAVGKSAKLSVKPILGVEVTGEFKEYKNEIIEVKKDGTVVALKEGTTDFAPNFILSNETKQKIKEAYIKQPGNEKVKIETIALSHRDIAQIFKMEVGNPTETKKHQIDITPSFSIDKEKLEVGESGKVSIAPIEGVALKGKYKPSKNDFIELKEDGTYTALKPNEQAVLTPFFEISEESLRSIKEAYRKKQGNEGIPDEDITFYQREMLQVFHIEIGKVVVPINWTVNIDKTTIKVGESAKLSLVSQYGYTPKGIYPDGKYDFVKVTKEGVITGIKVGNETVSTNFTLTDEEFNKIKEAYIKEKKLTNLTIEDLEIGPRPTNITSVGVEVVAASTGGGNNSGGNTTSKKTYAPVKKLPKTGEKQTIITIMSGFILIVSSSFYLNKRNKQELD
ncbi:LPXTG cell wall anchor domain-containing protein [Vagococcus carniphilus]|uniref:LPXTG cell wall anchor domain-containing protein n=1 Tax=Vagococcus carniphilus TaxID=218144 RepID=A0AAW8U4C9_9ENTE|nr:LPXTG cell wall anchor domain-containing protein [Vagococcus carniphilus]MDT2834408.1 LPXTG cell wall anchor domain-containing protein [Vagococcus carniphilus]